MTHINDEQLKNFQAQLLSSLEKLRNDVSDILLSSSHAGHKLAAKQLQKLSNDQLVELTSKLDVSSLAHKTNEIKSIDASLNDIELGLYGFCSDCEAEISIDKLQENVTTKRCDICEKKYQKQKYNQFKL
ncbi:dnaK suppressor [Psychromonas ingrahamii 37]|uniref:DnaK suppressor n=1 Tax=Psychromonas ingrahamii (strain DSM 17664 / CCUG 51855 / 37) TaxID=357804 RepID=A1SW83_PSYIN|nr:TraR/DksA C4-type zinc finger protein [Psychromonas ingrahamii]ABM03748.1 dnaK suppressor [Psychromonas ingrahamii 37]